MKKIVYICLISFMAIPICGQLPKKIAKALIMAGAGYKGLKDPILHGRGLQFPPKEYEVPSVGNLPILQKNPANNPDLLMGDQIKIDESMSLSFLREEIQKYGKQYKAQTDSINNLVRETLEIIGCDTLILYIYSLHNFTTRFFVYQTRKTANSNTALTCSDVFDTFHIGVYGIWPGPEPLYGINVACYRHGKPVPQSILEELADKVARFLELKKFVMEMPHYDMPTLKVPPHLLNNTPKQ